MKKGFTLVELLAVIVILAVILVIAIPQVLKVIDNSRLSAYIKNEQMLLKAVDVYVSRNTGELPGEIGSTTEVSINYLVSNGMLTEIKNPYNKNEDCTGYVIIMKLSDTEYDYTPHLRCGLDIHDSSDDELVAHWKLDGNAFDYSINDNHGILYGTTQENGGMKFNGSSDWIYFGNISSSGNKTISIWFNTDRTGSRYLFDGRDSGNWWWLLFYNGYDINFHNRVFYNGILTNKWYHAVVTANSTESRLYINGELKSVGPGININLSSVRIGTRYTNCCYISGLLKDVRIYNRVLSDIEIKLLYNTQK